MARWLAALLVLAGLGLAAVSAADLPEVREGDVIFHTSRSAQSLAIQRATGSRYSHMGLILFRDGKPYVFEAVSPVKFTPLKDWIARGEAQRYVVKRLRDPDRIDAVASRRMHQLAQQMQGKPYDLVFGWSDERLYCSELVWKLFDRALGLQVGQMQKVRDFKLDDPIVKDKMRERYGDAVPLDEPVISPAAMFDSELLETVAQH